MPRTRPVTVLVLVAVLVLGSCTDSDPVETTADDATITSRAPLVGVDDSSDDDSSDDGSGSPDSPDDGDTSDSTADDAVDDTAGDTPDDTAGGVDEPSDGAPPPDPAAPGGADLCDSIAVLAAADDPVFGSSDLFTTPAPALRDAFDRSTTALESAAVAAPDPVRGAFVLLSQVIGDFDGVLERYDHNVSVMLGAGDSAVETSLAAFDSIEYEQAVAAVGAHAGDACGVQLG